MMRWNWCHNFRRSGIKTRIHLPNHQSHFSASKSRLERIGHQYCGQTVYVDYPYLRGAKVTSVSDGRVEWVYEKDRDSKSRGTVFNSNLKRTVISSEKTRQWKRKVQKIEDHYLSRLGIKIGKTEFLLCVTQIVSEKTSAFNQTR